ncbi:MAG: hypothetical protein SGPRY_013711 [Prymnesium sp.]
MPFKPEASEQAKLKVLSGISALTSSIPEIKSLKCGLDAGLAEGNHDFVATVDFDSPLDYNTYATVRLPQHPRWYAFCRATLMQIPRAMQHPAHVGFINEYIKPILQTRSAVQFEMDSH